MARERHVQDTRERILKAAQKLFLEKSYQNVTTNDIAKIAGVSKGTIFHHFKTKEDLAIEVLSSLFKFDYFEEHARFYHRTTDPLRDIISVFIEFLGQSINLTAFYFDVLNSVSAEKARSIFAEIMNSYQPLFDLFRSLGSKDPEFHTRILFAILDGMGFQFYFQPSLLTPEFKEKLQNALYTLLKTLIEDD